MAENPGKRSFPLSASCLSFAVCILAIILAYRVQLTLGLLASPVRPFDFNPASFPAWFMIDFWFSDLVVILLLSLACCFVFQFEKAMGVAGVKVISRVISLCFLHFMILLFVLICEIHLNLLFTVQAGLDASALVEGVANISLLEVSKLLNPRDFLFLLAPFGLFWLLWLAPGRLRVVAAGVSAVLVLLLSATSLLASHTQTKSIPPELRLNPAVYLVTDVGARGLGKGRSHPSLPKSFPAPAGVQQREMSRLRPEKPFRLAPPQTTHPWNVVLIVMESVGTRYMFDEKDGLPVPMPFLHQISKEGWFLARHHTTSNVSTKALFSLLSGLYDLFGRQNFGVRPDAHVPWLYSFLGKKYESFLVTPSSLAWYFPSAFVKNSGFPEIHSYENLELRAKEEKTPFGRYVARDEVQTVDFFLRRLEQAREPFAALYVSFVAHFPYFDYGPQYRVRDPEGGLKNRYYNNLNLIDNMLKRIHERLKERGLLERTIFVVVGDHGQAFGQHHPDNYMHYRYSYSENVEAPVIFHQPAIFRPRRFDVPTSHVDVLPTLLDALRIPYDPVLLDGETLFQRKSKRRSIFFYGLEESISSIDDRQIKVQYSLKEKSCRAFELKVDPEEKNPIDCVSYQEQLEELRGFVNHHDASLPEYSGSRSENRDFHGHKHPSL